ncbi:efflux RND transporter periplasmic adaptor subunit [Ancylobacter sp. A5.8]|uniref:efflux RND transporter periplasmic adaptor subunit n=1 Tax=Ancylobacter gelatini TaxID=2919920 RepID=UPI001F4D5647|nr:efflux RND transporter periplasmic adaptor subunit [Ancylobacter gelatini]MCJ8144026.1 efflux RND transporter periplasmic adaptor subunit [Ancylobacter gelatini]
MIASQRIAFAAAALAALLAAGCKPEVQADPRQAPRLVQTANVQPAEPPLRAFTGVIAARVESNLGFRVPGKITERLVDTGQTVAAGQPLLRIDRTDLDLQIAAQERAVAAAEALRTQAAADEVRYRELRANGWATQQRYEQARAALDTANANLEAAKAEAQVARNQSSYAQLLADQDGVIVETLAEPGQVVSAGQAVVRLAHAGAREASVSLPESVRPVIGSVARASLYGGDVTASARLRQLSDSADPRTRTYDARYVLEGDAARAPLGATITINVPLGDPAALTSIPIAALNDEGGGFFVWVVLEGGRLERRAVEVRKLGAERVTLSSGVTAGETIVATGGHFLHADEEIRVAEQKAAMQ